MDDTSSNDLSIHDKLEKILEKLDALSNRVDRISARMDEVHKELLSDDVPDQAIIDDEKISRLLREGREIEREESRKIREEWRKEREEPCPIGRGCACGEYRRSSPSRLSRGRHYRLDQD